MNPPSTSITETLTKNEQVSSKKRAGKGRFGILPADVMANPRLSPAAKVVHTAMAMEAFLQNTDSLSISHQSLATLCGLARMTALNAVRQLHAERLIEPVGKPVKQIQCYKLLHPKLVAENATVTDHAHLHACAKCKKAGSKLDKACHCKRCASRITAEFRARLKAADASIERQIENLQSYPKKRAS